MSEERTRGLVLLGAVFLLGMVCGASLFYLGQRSMMPPRPPGPWIDRLSRDLDLDPDQRKKIEDVLAGHRAQMRKLMDDGRSGIRELLRPDQQKIFDAMPHDHPGRHGWPGPDPPPPDRP